MAFSWNNLWGGITDWMGLTDTGAGQRGLDALTEGANSASQTMHEQMQPVMDMYGNAMVGRDMGSVLDQYQQNMMGTENAASAGNVQNFMNPMYGQAMRQAANQALAGAGSSLQSSAANTAVGQGVGNTVQNMWNNAFQQAMTDAKNKQGIYGNVTNMNLMPSQNWSQLTSDMAGTEYTKNMDLAQAGGQVAGQNQSWLGNLF
jgi:hypothetical protein